MADEAVVRVVLDATAAATTTPPPAPPSAVSGKTAPSQQVDDQLVKALQRGSASVWAPPSQAIPTLDLKGLGRSQADYLRLESEAARRGMSVKDYKKAEVEASKKGETVPPLQKTEVEANKKGETVSQPLQAEPTPPVPTDAAVDDFEDRRRKREADRQRRQAEEEVELQRKEKEFNEQVADTEYESRRDARLDEVARRLAEDEARLQRIADEFMKDRIEPPDASAEVAEPTAPAPTAPAPTVIAPAEPTAETVAIPNKPESFEPEPGSPLARKQERQRQEAEAQYAKLKPAQPPVEPLFDPVALAKKRVQAEERRRLADAEYAKLKPPPTKGQFDAVMESLQSVRGTIDRFGTFGRVLASALDVSAQFRKMRGSQSPTGTQGPEAARGAPPTAQIAPEAPQAVPVDRPVPGAPVAQVVPSAIPPDAKAAAAPIAELGSTAGGVASKLVPLAAAAAAVTIGFNAITGALDKAVQRYGQVSPEVAQAQAMAEFRGVMNDIRRGQEHGAELARYVQSQANMQQKFEDAKMKVLMKLTPLIETIFDIVGDIADVVGNIPFLLTAIATAANPVAGVLIGISELVALSRKKDEKEQDLTNILYDPKGNDPGDVEYGV